MRIAVFDREANPEIDNPFYRVKLDDAHEIVNRGDAKWLNDRAIIALRRPHPAKESSQGRAYELLAIESHPLVVQGGLTRTETNPAIIKPFQGARVGHQ